MVLMVLCLALTSQSSVVTLADGLKWSSILCALAATFAFAVWTVYDLLLGCHPKAARSQPSDSRLQLLPLDAVYASLNANDHE